MHGQAFRAGGLRGGIGVGDGGEALAGVERVGAVGAVFVMLNCLAILVNQREHAVEPVVGGVEALVHAAVAVGVAVVGQQFVHVGRSPDELVGYVAIAGERSGSIPLTTSEESS